LQKRWDTGTDLAPWVRFDLINAFDWRNWTDFQNDRGGPGAGRADWGARNGDGILLPTRTFKLSMGFDW